jgi:single-strand DNA-binding protein
MSLNRVVLVGRLTADPEMKYTPTGVPVTQLRIAVNRVTKNEAGEYESDFFNVTAWRRTAEFCNNYLSKGRLISVDGRLQTRSWVDQTTGQKRTAFDIVADNVEGLDRKGDSPAMDSDEGSSYGGGAAAPRPAANVPIDSDDSDPFADE